ncbi:hypothetical protein [Roseibium sp. M-1]
MSVSEYFLAVAFIVLFVPVRWIWVAITLSFSLLVAANLLPRSLLQQLDIPGSVALTQFLLVAATASIRLGIERWRNR